MNFLRLIRNKIFLLLVAWRFSSVFIVQTSHVPDEYWQSLEVAHNLVFGYGYLTWEWQIGIRSYLYPFLISILYSIVKFLKFDYAAVLIYLPRIFQALLSAYTDYKFYVWTSSKMALFMLCLNWYWYYCATRTLINSFETCLTIIALSEYPWKDNPRKNSKFLWTVGLLCFIRPTAAVIWLPLCLYHLSRNRNLFTKYLIVGLCCFIISTSIDILCYKRFVLTPLEFFKINVLNKISEQYGTMHLMWYMSSGLPVLLGFSYSLIPYGVFKVCQNYVNMYKSKILLFVAVWSISIYSLLAHKEFRFILPLLPMFIYILNESVCSQKFKQFTKKFCIFWFIISNVLPGFYFSVLHQQGALQVMSHLRNEIEIMNASDVDILFLTKCHATPYYSHLHKNVSMRFLTCEPNLYGIKNYYDEADVFFMNPMKWLETNYLNENSVTLPSHMVVYDTTTKSIKPFLNYYEELSRYRDTHFVQHGNFNEFVIYKYKTDNKIKNTS